MSELDNAGIKALITLGIIVFMAVVAVVTAKLVRVCMDSRYTDDNDSVMSENTRDLIRARLSVIQFKKRELKKGRKEKAMSAFARWKEFVKTKKKVGVIKELKDEKETCVVHIEKINGVNGKIPNGFTGNKTGDHESKQNGKVPEDYGGDHTPRLTRLSSLTMKVPPPTTRPLPNTQKITLPSKDSDSPVPRGRPISSKRRALPNVQQTDLKRDPTMISLKAVHYEDNSSKSDNQNINEAAKT